MLIRQHINNGVCNTDNTYTTFNKACNTYCKQTTYRYDRTCNTIYTQTTYSLLCFCIYCIIHPYGSRNTIKNREECIYINIQSVVIRTWNRNTQTTYDKQGINVTAYKLHKNQNTHRNKDTILTRKKIKVL